MRCHSLAQEKSVPARKMPEGAFLPVRRRAMRCEVSPQVATHLGTLARHSKGAASHWDFDLDDAHVRKGRHDRRQPTGHHKSSHVEVQLCLAQVKTAHLHGAPHIASCTPHVRLCTAHSLLLRWHSPTLVHDLQCEGPKTKGNAHAGTVIHPLAGTPLVPRRALPPFDNAPSPSLQCKKNASRFE